MGMYINTLIIYIMFPNNYSDGSVVMVEVVAAVVLAVVMVVAW